MKKKYLVVPGHVISRTDDNRHYITATELIRLYQVNRDECIIKQPNIPVRLYHSESDTDLIILNPRYSGNYKIPE